MTSSSGHAVLVVSYQSGWTYPASLLQANENAVDLEVRYMATCSYLRFRQCRFESVC